MYMFRILVPVALVSLAACGQPATTESAFSARPSATIVIDSSAKLATSPAPTVGPAVAQPRVPNAALADDVPKGSIAQSLLRGPDDIHNRTEEAVKDCMDARGWQYRPWLIAAMPSELDQLQRTGFNIGSSRGIVAPLTRPDIGSPPNERLVASLDEPTRKRYLADLGNESESGGTGCRASGATDAQAGYPTYSPAAAALLADGLTMLANTPEVLGALGGYTKCMASAGITASSQSAAQRVEGIWDTTRNVDEALDREVHIAVSDYLCRASTTDVAYKQVEGPLIDKLVSRFPQFEDTVRALRS